MFYCNLNRVATFFDVKCIGMRPNILLQFVTTNMCVFILVFYTEVFTLFIYKLTFFHVLELQLNLLR